MPTLGYLYLVQGKQRPTILKKILKSVNCTQNKVNIQCTVHCSRPQSHTENRKTTDCEKHCRHPAINQKRCPKNPPWVTFTTIWQSLQTLSNQKNTNSHISKHKGNVEKRIADRLQSCYCLLLKLKNARKASQASITKWGKSKIIWLQEDDVQHQRNNHPWKITISLTKQQNRNGTSCTKPSSQFCE